MSNSSDDTHNLKVGQKVFCRILRDQQDGYAVQLRNHLAFLHTKHKLSVGDEVSATIIRVDPIELAGEDVSIDHFVCVQNHRILISARFLNNISKIPLTSQVRWEEHLDEIYET